MGRVPNSARATQVVAFWKFKLISAKAQRSHLLHRGSNLPWKVLPPLLLVEGQSPAYPPSFCAEANRRMLSISLTTTPARIAPIPGMLRT